MTNMTNDSVILGGGRCHSILWCWLFKRFVGHHGLKLVCVGSRVVEGGAEEGDSQRLADVEEGIDREVTIAGEPVGYL